MRTEQRYIRNNCPNDDVAALALLVGKYESRVCSLICSKLRKFRYFEDIVKGISARAYQATHSGAWRKFFAWACITISNLRKTMTGWNPGMITMNLQESIFLEAGKGHLPLRKAIANGVQKIKVR